MEAGQPAAIAAAYRLCALGACAGEWARQREEILAFVASAAVSAP